MHEFLESVRNEIENEAGQESYLTSSLFLRLYRHIGYEDNGEYVLKSKEDFEKILHKAINCLNHRQEFDLKDEILAWQVAIVRDITREFYGWWVNYKDKKFGAEDCFSNGEPCIALESTAEDLNESPTDLHTKILEIELLLAQLYMSCNKTLIDVDNYWQFQYKNRKKAPENRFLQKRIEAERKNTIIFSCLSVFEEMRQTCLRNEKRLSGADHLLWATPRIMIESLICAFTGILEFEYVPDEELSIDEWLENLFPKRLPDNNPNPMHESGLHHKIVGKLAQATQCLVEHQVKRTDAFVRRDNIVKPHIISKLEEMKMVRLKNLQSEKESDLQENHNSS